MQYIKEELRRRILDTALEEFDIRGYEGASMRAIAEGAGTSLGNLYRYFRNKDDLYLSCLLPVLDEGIVRTAQFFDVSEAALSLTAAGMAEYVSSHPREYRIIVQGPARHYTAFRNRFAACIAENLRRHTGNGAPAVSPSFLDTVAQSFIHGLRVILETSRDEAQTRASVLELMRFLFQNFDDRLRQLEPPM